MKREKYDILVAELENIATNIQLFPDSLHKDVYHTLVNALLNDDTQISTETKSFAESADIATIDAESEPVLLRNYATELHEYYLKYELEKRNDMEVAAFLAHYFTEIAPTDVRVEAIEPKHIEELCQITGRPLPKDSRSTLTNAKNKKKYLESDGKGFYTLSTIGQHYVKHRLLTRDD